MNPRKKLFLILGSIWLATVFLQAEQIVTQDKIDLADRAQRFLLLKDESVQIVVFGSVLMGMSCGLIGSYVVTRKLSLFGDTLSHAVLPGIAVGFIWSGEKNNISLLVGATIAGLLGISCLSILRKFTKVQDDSSLGIVLSAFYAVGICLLTRIQKVGYSDQSGLDSFMFGQASALSSDDLIGIIIVLLLISLFIVINYKELLISGFDPGFSRSIGIPTESLQYGLWALITFCVISSLQMVGVILASALLVIPAATASLLVKRMRSYLILACLLGAVAGFGGAFLSFLGERLPTGPLIVIVSGALFTVILFLRPQKGLLIKWVISRSENVRIARENSLKAAFQIIEGKSFEDTLISSQEMMRKRGMSSATIEGEIENLCKAGLASKALHQVSEIKLPRQTRFTLTPSGWEYACRIVRNHRLWELYLTNEAQYAPDHVHEDAEKIEHVIGEETVRQIERLLKNPRRDPHGKLIPSITDIQPVAISQET